MEKPFLRRGAMGVGRILLFVFFVFFSGQAFCGRDFFRECPFSFSNEKVVTSPDALLKAAEYALSYFVGSRRMHKHMTKSKQLEPKIISNKQVEDTLRFIVHTIKTDKKLGRPQRILDQKFLQKNFSFIRWYGDSVSATNNGIYIPKWCDDGKLSKGKIRLTSYAVFRREASFYKTEKQPYAIYEIKSREFKNKLRLLYSKQDVLTGVLDQEEYKKHVRPVVWLSRKDLEEALMQGSVVAVLPNGTKKLLNVHKSNEMLYDKKMKDKMNQKKYWYFREIKGREDLPTISISEPYLTRLGGAVFAGDEPNLGLGKIIALQYKNVRTQQNEFRLGVLADRGSAFLNNLYQLDFFAGVFNSRSEFDKFTAKFPPTVTAYILKKRPLMVH